MVATTTAKISLLIKKLESSELLAHIAQPISFESGLNFIWHFETRTIQYNPHDADAEALILHEVGHAMLDHREYRYDIHLVEMERAAWDTACEIAPSLGVKISKDDVEDSLDTYRDWLHSRSTCPCCGSTGVQDGSLNFTCLACHHEWHANEARSCQLRRYPTKKRP